MTVSAPIQRVGFVGLGKMGEPMAGHLAKAGFILTVADEAPGIANKFVSDHGGKVATSLIDLAREVEAVITMLPNGLIVREVLSNGILQGLEPGSVVIDMSTSNPVETRETANQAKTNGITMVDCPVAGGVIFAKDATLTITTGGDEGVLARCRPLLDVMGKKIIHCGDIGAGHAMKALNNFINASLLITAFEALSIGKSFGMESETMLQSMMAATTSRNSPISKKVKPYLNDSNYTTGMALSLLAKDVRIVAEMADALEKFAPIAEQCSALWTDAEKRFGGNQDQIDVARLWFENT